MSLKINFVDEWIPSLAWKSQVSFLSETQHSASATCQRAVCQSACGSQITLWWRVTAVIVVCSLHSPISPTPPQTHMKIYGRRGLSTYTAGHGGHRTGEGKRRCTRGWRELLWPGVEDTVLLTAWGGQIMKSSRTIILKSEDFSPRKRGMLEIKNMERK